MTATKFQPSPAMRPLLLLCLKYGKVLLVIGSTYLLIASATAILAAAMPATFESPGRSLIESMSDYGALFAAGLALLGLELWVITFLLRAIPPDTSTTP